MKNAVLILLAWLLIACDKEPVTPDWYDSFLATAEASSDYPSGTRIQRCLWEGEWVFEVINPLSSCIGCEVITVSGDTLRFGSTPEQLDYLQGRRKCEEIWRKE